MCEPLKYGMPLNKFVFETFSDCIYTIPEHISFVLGIVGLFHNEKSVHGISLAMLILNVFGNGCYGLSVLIRLDKVDIEFWLCIFPYMVGVLLLDVVRIDTLVQTNKPNPFLPGE
jgi:hypothetical protein